MPTSIRQRAYLKKNRPATPNPDQAPTTPTRPVTSAGTSSFSPDTARSRHTIHFSHNTPDQPSTASPFSANRPSTATPTSGNRTERPQTSTPLSANRRWGSLHRPKSSYRPATSAGVESERPMTSAGERGAGEHKEKKRWSLRRMFRS
jgi:hypothetical protein